MEHREIIDGPNLRTLELALFGDSYNSPTPVTFIVQDNNMSSCHNCLIDSCKRVDTEKELWNFTGWIWKTVGSTFSLHENVRGSFSTRTRKGWIEIGTPGELFENYQMFLDILRVELHNQRVSEDREAEVHVYLGPTLIASIKMAIGFYHGADGGIYTSLDITKTGDVKKPPPK